MLCGVVSYGMRGEGKGGGEVRAICGIFLRSEDGRVSGEAGMGNGTVEWEEESDRWVR